MKEEIKITSNLSEEQKEQVANLYVDVFQTKMQKLWLFTEDNLKGSMIVRRCLDFSSGMYALENEKVLGFIGFNTDKSQFYKTNFKAFNTVYGIFGSLWRFLITKYIYKPDKTINEDTFNIDAIGVSKEARGKGIGTILLGYANQKAKEQGKTIVTLEVINTNEGALKLYKSIDYLTYHTEHTGNWTKRAGFTDIFYMKKLL